MLELILQQVIPALVERTAKKTLEMLALQLRHPHASGRSAEKEQESQIYIGFSRLVGAALAERATKDKHDAQATTVATSDHPVLNTDELAKITAKLEDATGVLQKTMSPLVNAANGEPGLTLTVPRDGLRAEDGPIAVLTTPVFSHNEAQARMTKLADSNAVLEKVRYVSTNNNKHTLSISRT